MSVDILTEDERKRGERSNVCVRVRVCVCVRKTAAAGDAVSWCKRGKLKSEREE